MSSPVGCLRNVELLNWFLGTLVYLRNAKRGAKSFFSHTYLYKAREGEHVSKTCQIESSQLMCVCAYTTQQVDVTFSLPGWKKPSREL
jgi:hypothetical protein